MTSKKEILEKKQYKLDKKQELADLMKKELEVLSWVELSEITWIGTSSITRIKNGTESMSLKKIEQYINLLKNL